VFIQPLASGATTSVELGERPPAAHQVPCIYCDAAIPAEAFAFWSDLKRLVSADCPSCGRTVTLPTRTWRRLSRQGPVLASSGPQRTRQ
jgi:hypothetical protein